MKIPNEINNKIRLVNKLNNEIIEWLDENIDTEGMSFDGLFWKIVPEPQGESQCEDDSEYCAQNQIGEDWFYGEYYYQLEGESNYIEFHYEL